MPDPAPHLSEPNESEVAMSDRHLKHWPKHAARQLTIPETSLWFNVEASAQRFPDKAAIIFYDRVISFAALRSEAEKLAGFLQQTCGVKRGDRVALYMQNSPQFMVAFYAILRADAMVVPLNPMLLNAEIAHIVQDSGATVLIAGQELLVNVQSLLGQQLQHAIVATYSDYLVANSTLRIPEFVSAPRQTFTGTGITAWVDAMACDLVPAPHLAGADDLCVMPYTSGTTGFPKGCVHKHRSVMFVAVCNAQWYGKYQDEVALAVLPYFHVTGMQAGMNTPLYIGATVVIMPRWDRDVAAELVQRYRITSWTTVPTMVVDFLMNPQLAKYDLSSLRFISGGGAAMPAAIAQKLQDVCGLRFLEGYGLSETIAATHMNPRENPKQQCLGIPIFNVDSRVVDPQTLQELPPGEIGEIITHGPGVFAGYWNNPEANAECFVEIDGKRFFRTGDLGRIDEDGYFFMVDRLKRMINASGFKIWPAEVEAMLYAHPAIAEAVIISKKDQRRGETVKAVIVLREAARGTTDAQAIIDWAHAHMAAYKVPHHVEFVDQLPKSGSGKILWRVLQEKEDASAR
jgi:fatty-acyl-CoA synthase